MHDTPDPRDAHGQPAGAAPLSGEEGTPDAARPLQIGFVMSTEVGMLTQYLNWRACLPPEAGVVPSWAVIDWWREGGAIERVPGLPRGLKSRIRAQLDLRAGLGNRHFDALYVGVPAVFYGQRHWLDRQPYVIDTDSTLEQLWSFGGLYARRPSRLPFMDDIKFGGRRRQYAEALALIAWSHWAADGLIATYGVDPSRVHVIPPGVDLSCWTFPARPEDDTRPVNVLFVGGDFERKGGDLVLAWAERTRLTNWRLHLVTRDRPTISHPNVQVYNGLSSNDPALLDLYARADVFALPTRGDCYSLASIEAMAAGLPVVLSRVGGTGDIIREAETGFLIAPGDGDALAARLDDLIAEPSARRAMGRAARCDAEARYDARANILQIIGVLRAALGR
ncbi:MAG: glycosyltransferase family 4 protein [Chloroflexi bacterium]|nr:glycosyltransferase family 4 protein [Chloroflexota bacterium]